MLRFGSELYFNTLTQHSRDLICVVGADLAMRYVSASSRTLLGWEPQEIVGMPPFSLIHPEDRVKVRDAAGLTLDAKDNIGPPLELRMLRKDGVYTWVESMASVVRDPENPDLREIVLVMRDISARVQESERLERLSRTDGLTGLLNRRGFDAMFQAAWQKTAREGSGLSVILLDVDYFKAFNDTYGHQLGDDCLTAVANAVAGCVPQGRAQVARYGGEELAVILPDMSAEPAAAVAESLRLAVQALQLPHAGSPATPKQLSVSLGVATAMALDGGCCRMPQGLLQAADRALYDAKRNGRNCVATTFLLKSKDLHPAQKALHSSK